MQQESEAGLLNSWDWDLEAAADRPNDPKTCVVTAIGVGNGERPSRYDPPEAFRGRDGVLAASSVRRRQVGENERVTKSGMCQEQTTAAAGACARC